MSAHSMAILGVIGMFWLNAALCCLSVGSLLTGFTPLRRLVTAKRRTVLIAAAVTYLAAGVCMGATFKLAMPATSYAGAAYLTVIWPAWIAQDLTGLQPPVPAWAFDLAETESPSA